MKTLQEKVKHGRRLQWFENKLKRGRGSEKGNERVIEREAERRENGLGYKVKRQLRWQKFRQSSSRPPPGSTHSKNFHFSSRGKKKISFLLALLALDITANYICEIQYLALDGFDLNTVHKLRSKEILRERKILAELGYEPGAAGWEARMLRNPPPHPQKTSLVNNLLEFLNALMWQFS